MASKNFVVKHGITVGGVEVIDATGQITSQALGSIVIAGATKTSDLTNDSGFITSSALTGYALSSSVPTDTNQLANGADFATTTYVNTAVADFATTTYVNTAVADFATTTYVSTAVTNAVSASIGDINSALDAINGTSI